MFMTWMVGQIGRMQSVAHGMRLRRQLEEILARRNLVAHVIAMQAGDAACQLDFLLDQVAHVCRQTHRESGRQRLTQRQTRLAFDRVE